MERTSYKRIIPLDGPGPRGAPDCYYLSRHLLSTKRYADFIKALRKSEIGKQIEESHAEKEKRSVNWMSFSNRNSRRKAIKSVSMRVNNCLQSYEIELKERKSRLKLLLEKECEEDMKKCAVIAQKGVQLVAEDRKVRLAELRNKRNQEKLKKYKDPPLSACPHVTSEIFSINNKICKESNKHQIREKQALKMKELEFDKMWYEVGIKREEATSTRIMQNEIDRVRKQNECTQSNNLVIESIKQRKEVEKEENRRQLEMLKQQFQDMLEQDKLEKNAELQKNKESMKQMIDALNLSRAIANKRRSDEELTNNTFDVLVNQQLMKLKGNEETVKKINLENLECNRKLRKQREEVKEKQEHEVCEGINKLRAESDRIETQRRCEFILKSEKLAKEARQYQLEQLGKRKVLEEERKKEFYNERENVIKKLKELEQEDIVIKKKIFESQKKHQSFILNQLEEWKKAKDLELDEERAYILKCRQEAKQYDELLKSMLKRDSFSDHVHQFKKVLNLNVQMPLKVNSNDFCKY